MNWKRFFIEYVMGMCFFMSGAVGVKFQTTRDMSDLLIMMGLNVMGWVFFRILVRTAPKLEENEEDQDGEA